MKKKQCFFFQSKKKIEKNEKKTKKKRNKKKSKTKRKTGPRPSNQYPSNRIFHAERLVMYHPTTNGGPILTHQPKNDVGHHENSHGNQFKCTISFSEPMEGTLYLRHFQCAIHRGKVIFRSTPNGRTNIALNNCMWMDAF